MQRLSAMRHAKLCRNLLKLISRQQLVPCEARIKFFSYTKLSRSISTCCSNLKLHHVQPKVVSSPQHAELFVASLRKSDRVILEEALMKYNSANQGLCFLQFVNKEVQKKIEQCSIVLIYISRRYLIFLSLLLL